MDANFRSTEERLGAIRSSVISRAARGERGRARFGGYGRQWIANRGITTRCGRCRACVLDCRGLAWSARLPIKRRSIVRWHGLGNGCVPAYLGASEELWSRAGDSRVVRMSEEPVSREPLVGFNHQGQLGDD